MARGPDEEATHQPAAASPRVGIFGGTFDPPHVGHVRVAADVADALALDRVLWIPAPEPPHKDPEALTPYALRVEMARAAASADERFEVSEVEAALPRPSYTVNTLRALSAEEPDWRLFLIVGADEYEQLDTWREPDELTRLATLVVMNRADREGRGAHPERDAAVRFVDVTPLEVSASGIRRRVARGEDVAGMVPEGVLAVIRREALYLTGS